MIPAVWSAGCLSDIINLVNGLQSVTTSLSVAQWLELPTGIISRRSATSFTSPTRDIMNISSPSKQLQFLEKLFCSVGGQVKHLADYQLVVDKGKLTAVANFEAEVSCIALRQSPCVFISRSIARNMSTKNTALNKITKWKAFVDFNVAQRVSSFSDFPQRTDEQRLDRTKTNCSWSTFSMI